MLHRRDVPFTKPKILPDDLTEYVLDHTTPLDGDLAFQVEATREGCPEWADIATDPVQMQLLATLVRIKRPRRILEVGTFTAHASLAMAAELSDGGELVTVDNFAADERARKSPATGSRTVPTGT